MPFGNSLPDLQNCGLKVVSQGDTEVGRLRCECQAHGWPPSRLGFHSRVHALTNREYWNDCVAPHGVAW